MKILVIDDSKRNQVAAVQSLAGHDVTVARGAEEGFALLKQGGWDTVLTDLFMPLDFRPSALPRDKVPSGEIPVGAIFALLAINLGIERVVICTDANHHQDVMATLLVDYSFSGPHIERRIVTVEARMARLEARWDEASQSLQAFSSWDDPIVKDWLMAMQQSELFTLHEMGLSEKRERFDMR